MGGVRGLTHAALGHRVPRVSTTPNPWSGVWRSVQTQGGASPPFSTQATGWEIARLGQDLWSPASQAYAPALSRVL